MVADQERRCRVGRGLRAQHETPVVLHLFSLAPTLLIVISVAGLVFGEEAARGEIFGQLRGLMGVDAARLDRGCPDERQQAGQGIAATVTGLVLLLIGATTVFGELQDALDRIWRAPVRDKTGVCQGLLRERLLSFGMILGIGFLLIVPRLSAAIAALGRWWAGRLAVGRCWPRSSILLSVRLHHCWLQH